MDRVIFYFDPRCPWCYQTARWVRRLAELGEVDVDWRPFSLEVVNRPEGTDAADLEKTGSPALRTAVLLASECGSPALGPFYAALGQRTFEVAPPSSDQQATIRESLAEVGHDPELCNPRWPTPRPGRLSSPRPSASWRGSASSACRRSPSTTRTAR